MSFVCGYIYIATTVHLASSSHCGNTCFAGSLDAHPCLALERLLTVLQCDEYDVQQEAVFCLEQACADEDLLQLLLSSPVYRPHLLPLARLVERLLRSPSCDVPLSCMRIVSALTSAAKTSGSSSGSGGGGGGDSGRLCELVNMWVEAGITEALDDIQVGIP